MAFLSFAKFCELVKLLPRLALEDVHKVTKGRVSSQLLKPLLSP
jgi:hypothetical protein